MDHEEIFKQCFPNFRATEFYCPCGQCQGGVAHHFMAQLQNLRWQMGFPFHINSGYRCPEYNASLENSSPNSKHMLGIACDISTASLDSKQKHDLIGKAFLHFTGIGIYKNFIHLDLRAEKERAMWWGSY